VPIADAEAFYQKRMSAIGWTLARRQTSETSFFGGPSVVMDWTLGGTRANIMLIFSPTENYTMVLLTLIK
jgi:hypothetical protein